jgi:cytochrome P450
VLVPRYDDVKAIASDPSRFSSDHSRKGTRAQATRDRLATDRERRAFEEVMAFESNFLNRADGEHHARLRGAAHRAFTPRRIGELADAVARYSATLVAELDRQRNQIVDMVEFAYELPLQVICDMLGVPPTDRHLILEWGRSLTGNRDGVDTEALLTAHEAWLAFDGYVRDLIAEHRRRRGAGGPFVEAMLEAEKGQWLDDDEVAAEFVMMLLGGHETVSNFLSGSLLGLLRQRDQWEEIVADSAVIPTAVEELLRFVTPSQLGSRRAVVVVTLGEVEIEPDQTVVAMRGSANRDPSVFDEPDRIDVRRPNVRQHLGLGFGPHYCLGSSLARLEAARALSDLATAFPEMELATDEFEWIGPASLRRVVSVPVRLGERPARRPLASAL